MIGKVISRLVDIGILEEYFSSEYTSSFPSFSNSKKNRAGKSTCC
jgi:hypothetical protein